MVPKACYFKNSLAEEVAVMLLQPFTKSHFHFFITVEYSKRGNMHDCAHILCRKMMILQWNKWSTEVTAHSISVT